VDGGLGGATSPPSKKNARLRAQLRRTTGNNLNEALTKQKRSGEKLRFGCKDKPRQRTQGAGSGKNVIKLKLPTLNIKKFIPWC